MIVVGDAGMCGQGRGHRSQLIITRMLMLQMSGLVLVAQVLDAIDDELVRDETLD